MLAEKKAKSSASKRQARKKNAVAKPKVVKRQSIAKKRQTKTTALDRATSRANTKASARGVKASATRTGLANTKTRSLGKRGAVNRSKDQQKRAQLKHVVAMTVVWCSVLGFGFLGWDNAKKFFTINVQRVVIEGALAHVDRQQLTKAIEPLLDEGFFSLDLDSIKQRLEEFSWVYHARISRRWPSGIGVLIEEQTPIAIWNSDALLNSEGTVFSANNDVSEFVRLPMLYGPEGTEQKLIQRYMEFNGLLKPVGQSILEFRFDQTRDMSAKLQSGAEIRFGDERLLEKMKRFLMMYERELGNKMDQLEYVDLRYQNGMAVRWKQRPASGVEQLGGIDAVENGKVGYTTREVLFNG